jgi:hypothetical protein
MSQINPELAQRLANMDSGSYGAGRDMIRHQIFDKSVVQNLQEEIFFVEPQGATKDASQTNLRASGQLPEGQSFGAQLLSVAMVNKGTADALFTQAQRFIEVVQESVIEIQLASREFELQISGHAFFPSLMTVGIPAASAQATAIGGNTASGSIVCKPEIIISQRVSFRVRMFSPASQATNKTALNSAGVKYVWALDGWLARRK